jgi:hypothetical protein
MNLQSKVEQFCADNPYDADTQAKRLLAGNDEKLILYVLALGLATAKARRRHAERDYMKNLGHAPPQERLAPGRVTGSVKLLPSKKTRNAMQQMLLDVWRINGEQKLGDANENDLSIAIKREVTSSAGHDKNAQLYKSLKKDLGPHDIVRDKWDEQSVRDQIEQVYGEFRKSEAA